MNTGHFTIRRVINYSPRREVIRILIHFPGNAYYGIFVDYIRINLLLFCSDVCPESAYTSLLCVCEQWRLW